MLLLVVRGPSMLALICDDFLFVAALLCCWVGSSRLYWSCVCLLMGKLQARGLPLWDSLPFAVTWFA